MSTRPRITYGPWGESLEELVAASRAAEEAGAEVLWLPELHRSATVPAALIAAATSHVKVGTAIALAFARSPMITALEALDIDEASGGRFLLGLGPGVRKLNEDWHNVQWGKPVAHIRETVAAIRHFVANAGTGHPMILEGTHEPMRIRGYERPFAQARQDIPVYLAGMGPAMTRLAGRIGTGWISHELCSPDWLRERALPALEEGLQRGERHREDLDVVVSASCSIDADGALARRRAAGVAGFYASVRTYADFFEFHGLGEDQKRVIEAFRSGTGAEHLSDAVSTPMIDTLTLAGTASEVGARIEGYTGLADSVKITPPTHLEPEETRRAQDRIIEFIREWHA